MPKFNILKKTEVEKTGRVLQLSGLFDIPPSERSENAWNIDLPIENDDWQIGLIVGSSGSGKSTLAKEAFKESRYTIANQGYEWPKNKSIVDGFDSSLSIKEITAALSSVGFSSPPAWVRPFDCLSTGEQFRATLARAILDESPIVVVDEFTSVIDRTVAKIGSAAVAKAIRKTKQKKIVAVTCHYDVEEWLCPDWVLEMPKGNFSRRLLQRPKINIEIKRVHHSAWELFKKHHYLSSELNKASICFCGFFENQPIVFCSVISFPHPVSPSWREHRTVVLPDFQGVGIGNKISEFVAGMFKASGKNFISTSGNPAFIQHRKKNSNWKLTKPMKINSGYTNKSAMKSFVGTSASNRYTAAFQYIGEIHKEDAKKFGLI